MKSRCYNCNTKSYSNYGGRGIKICSEWLKAEPFLLWCDETYIEGYTLDRINNNKDYGPTNCKWSSKLDQMSNRRITKKYSDSSKKVQKKAIETMHNKYGNPRTRTKKICSSCKERKLLNSFYKNKYSIDKVGNKCKLCYKKFVKVHEQGYQVVCSKEIK